MGKFRDLRVDEIECRIAMVKEGSGGKPGGVSLLLYKDARVDQNILDETVGPMGWMREHQTINGNLYCTVTLWDEEHQRWVSKQDVGTESNTEATKGEASDSFKRACFNWGIGRELYTAPFIWVSEGDNCKISQKKCYDRYSVKSIAITDKKITALEIVNSKNGQVVYRMAASPSHSSGRTANSGTQGNRASAAGSRQNSQQKPSRAQEDRMNREMMEKAGAAQIDVTKIKVIKDMIAKKGLSPQSILGHYRLERFEDMTIDAWKNAMQILERYQDRKAS